MTDKELWWSRVKWYFYQLLPLRYHSEYDMIKEKKRINVTWWMWFGYSFWINQTESPIIETVD